MKRIASYLLLLVTFLMVIPMSAQKNGTVPKKKITTQTTKKTTTGKSASTTTKKPSSTTRKHSVTTTKKGNGKKNTGKKTTKKTGKGNTPAYETTAEIKGLQNERNKIQKEISTKEKELKRKETDVRARLNNLVQINTEIEQRQKTIDTIQSDIDVLDDNIGILKSQLRTLETQLGERREKFVESMRYMARHRSVQDKLMFIFSAKSFTQMYRRLRFVREYAAYQRAQGQLLMDKQRQVDEKNKQLETVRSTKSNLLYKGRKAHAELQGRQEEQKQVVASLQAEQKTLQGVLAQQRQKQAELNAKIDNLVAIEIRKARERAAAEEKKRAAAIAAEKKKRAEEAARKKAEAEAKARENARRIAEAKAREEKAKAEARAAAEAAEAARKARADADKKKEREQAERAAAAAAEKNARAEQALREAEAARVAAERKADADNKRAEQVAAAAKRDAEAVSDKLSSEDRKMSGSFANNKGRLPYPISGRIIGHYGQYNVEGLKNVTLSNNGITLKGSPGTIVRSVYAGEVSAVFGFGDTKVVMVRHGSYISVYCNLKTVSVSRGQKVSARQALGAVGDDGIMQFQLRNETQKLNPEAWIR